MFSEYVGALEEAMVQIWIIEGLINTKADEYYDYVLNTGESYVKLPENRCLF